MAFELLADTRRTTLSTGGNREHTFEPIGGPVIPRLIQEEVLKCTGLQFRQSALAHVGEHVSGKHVLLVCVEIAANPGHCDDEGEDGEADYEEDFIAHD